MPWELVLVAFGLTAWTGATFYSARLLVTFWLATEGREMVRAEVLAQLEVKP